MCGRFTLHSAAEQIAAQLQIEVVPDLQPQYNIAPTQMILAVLNNGEQRQVQFLRWGLIPSWAKDINIGAKLINARSETVTEKPSFRQAFKHRRCLIVADGFYEWQSLGKSTPKQPIYFYQQNRSVFAFAGLWERWHSREGEQIDSCTILTTTANELVEPIHQRMPVILPIENYDTWLNPHVEDSQKLQNLLQAYPSNLMQAHPVSRLVNNVRNNNYQCIEGINPQPV